MTNMCIWRSPPLFHDKKNNQGVDYLVLTLRICWENQPIILAVLPQVWLFHVIQWYLKQTRCPKNFRNRWRFYFSVNKAKYANKVTCGSSKCVRPTNQQTAINPELLKSVFSFFFFFFFEIPRFLCLEMKLGQVLANKCASLQVSSREYAIGAW